MNINNDSNLLASFMDEEEGAPELPDNRSSVGPNAIQNNFKTDVPVTNVAATDVFNTHSSTMMPLPGQTRIMSPVQLKPTVVQSQVVRTNISVGNTVINSPTNPPVLSASLVSVCEHSADVSSPVSSYCMSSNLVLSPNTPARKRLKLSDGDVVSISDDLTALKKRILEHKLLRMKSLRERYAENAAELFYLQAGGNMIDYQAWRKRPPTQQLLSFFRTNRLDISDESEDLARVLGYPAPASVVQQAATSAVPQGAEIKIPGVGVTPVAVSTTLPAAVAQLSQQGSLPGRPAGGRHGMVFATHRHLTSVVTPRLPGGTPLIVDGSPSGKPVPTVGFNTTPSTSSSQEHIVEKAKQEAYVMQRISELQKEGLWTEKRLPKVMEPPRTKAHWDYLLEEMVWLAADFAQERKWKKAAAKKCARMIQKHFQEKALAAQKAEKAQELQLRRIASFVAKEIKIFWSNVEKLVEFKQQTRLEEQRKQALDQQLSFIVDQTEKYSQQLAEGMQAKNQKIGDYKISAKSSTTGSTGPSDDEFCPSGVISTDDEETIDAAEKEENNDGVDSQRAEIEALQRESQMDLDEFLNELPENYLENRDKIKLSDSESSDEMSGGEDSEFQADGNSSDDEDTIMEQEKQECENDHKQEIDDLKAESQMSIEELMKKYSGTGCQALSPPLTDDETSSSTAMEEDTDDDEEEGESEKETSDSEQAGLDVLIKETKTEDVEMNSVQDDHRMEDAAAIAESIQPTGNTLSSTQVVTKVPFLLRHSLREYQHIGLDWLVTMEQRRLNGILADEMGLGKTIQTISLLAHLACEKGDWGPHLIVVPTSVMLNWEMEFKKWCPAFKILTYYGTIKERKLKRIGWTKPNAFHICITSYKLVIQDHQSFRRKKWKYLILDEAQNIKNFKSQRWQLLLNFQTQQRLLLTGTPLQNNLMELWSLMHFLMPDVFASHREFKEWFSNPVSGMIEGNSEYNESIIKRLHKVLRPFLLRRLKSEVEKQMPKKYEHVIMCRLSKRQRFLYDDFMSRAKTKETLATGNLLSVINVLMQLRKVCNHPNLFEVRPIISPFQMCAIDYHVPSLVYNATNYDPFKHIDLSQLNLNLLLMERTTSAFCSHRVRHLSTPRKLIEELDSAPPPPPPCPTAEIRMHITVRPCAPVLSTSVPAGSTPVGASPRANGKGEMRRCPIVPRARPVMRVAPLPPALVQPLTPRMLRQLTAARTAAAPPLTSEITTEPMAPVSADSEFVEVCLQSMLADKRREKLHTLGRINERRCSAFPLYGTDLRAALAVPPPTLCSALAADINTIEKYTSGLKDIFERYIVCIPAAVSSGVHMRMGHGAGPRTSHERRLETVLLRRARVIRRLLHVVQARMMTYFPDARLIQYDCGKLQMLDVLLRKLRSEQHRVLIFTQMTRMLDVLEAFLTFHGHIYLRLDGTTRVDQRQTLMERFNADSRIFAFILSTRSGGVGVNLTGADTVIFYDSDWNPTMDAQAQDRCHRIGQTRDVHIYRLISERTVEENILKKANQKRMLGDVAIEGGNFTTAYFKSSTIQDLFNVGATSATELIRSVEEQDAAVTAAALESALAQAEDEADVAAARCARAEAAADLAEFDETIPIEADRVEHIEHVSKAEMELRALMDQLSPIERYAMRLVENSEAATSAEQAAVAEMARQRRDWEAARRALQRDTPTPAGHDDDDRDLTFSRRDAINQVWISDNTKENMPMWCPPTPPQGEGDVYLDRSLGYLYEWNAMTEAQLPPVYVRRENKRTRADTVHSPDNTVRRHNSFKTHGRREDAFYAPRSLFERPSPALAKIRREIKLHKYRGSSRAPASTPVTLTTLTKPAPRPYLEPETVPEWTVAEEMALLQAVKAQGLPLSLTTLSPAHTPNWDLAADTVNNTSRIYRSPRQCRNRYESVVMPREEGKLLLDAAQKKPKKTKGPCKTLAQQKGSRSMRTSQLYESDNNATFTQAILSKYEAMKSILNKKASTPKRRYDDPTMKNPKHAAVLAEYGVNYETPPTPMEVASRRADRIAKEKQKSATEQAATAGSTVSLPTRGTVATQVAPSPPPVRGTITTTRAPEPQQQASTTATAAQQTARPQRIVVAAQQVSTVVAKGAATQAQAALYRQQALVRQQMKMLQAGVSVAGTVPTTISVTTQQRAQIVSQASKAGVVARVPEGEINALLKRQQALGQQKVAQQTLAAHQPQQLQVATVSLASGAQGMKMATPQQLRQLQLQQQLALAQRKGQKVTQLTQVAGTTQVMVTGAVRPRMLPRAPHQLVLSHVSAALQPRATTPSTSAQPSSSTDAEQR